MLDRKIYSEMIHINLREREGEREVERVGADTWGGRGGTSLPLAYGIFVPISEWLLVAFSYLLLIVKLLDPKTTPLPSSHLNTVSILEIERDRQRRSWEA